MDPSASPSFIPKKPLMADTRSRGRGMSLLSLIAVLIFVASFVAAAAAFAYKLYLERTIATASQKLDQAKESYGSDTIEDLVRLDNRLNSAKKILATHVSDTAIFSFLSEHTLEKVQFNSFDLERGTDPAAGAKLMLHGEADSFSTIALQSDEFGANKAFHNVVFSDIVISTETGRVTFAVRADVDTDLLLYSRNVGTSVQAPPPAAQSEVVPEVPQEQPIPETIQPEEPQTPLP